MTPLEVSLRVLTAVAPEGEWWLIGSAAAKLSGIDMEPEDVDVLGASEVIEAFMSRLGAARIMSESPLFRSTPFARLDVKGGLPVDLMGDLHVNRDGWRLLKPETRHAIQTPAGIVHVPSLAEQVAIFERFGRPKDLVKAERIRVSVG